MKVLITKRHIAEGIRNRCCLCPIARALRDRFGGHPSVGTMAYVADRAHTLTTEANNFIANFDAGRPVSPGWLTVWE